MTTSQPTGQPDDDHLGEPPPSENQEAGQDSPTEDRSQNSFVKLLSKVVFVSRGTASKVTALLTAAAGLTSGFTQFLAAASWIERITASVTAVGVVVSTVLLFLVTSKGEKGVVAGHFARAMVVIVTIAYGGIILWAVGTNLGPDGAWVRMSSGLSLVLLMSTFALAARSADREPSGPEAAYPRTQKILFFLLGTAVFGAGTALIARGMHDANRAPIYQALPALAEGALICTLGLTLLLARRAVAAIVTIGAGVMIAIFGIASMLNGQMDLGSWTAFVGASTILVGVAFRWQLAALGKLGFAAGALSSTGIAVYAMNTHTMAFSATMAAVAAVLTGVTVVVCIMPIGVWQFEAPDDHQPWSLLRVITSGVLAILSGAGIVIATVWVSQNLPMATIAQFVGVSVSLVVIGILVLASRRLLCPLPKAAALLD